jgi:hypothetical protein
MPRSRRSSRVSTQLDMKTTDSFDAFARDWHLQEKAKGAFLGNAPDDRLRWVVETFCRANLPGLLEEEQIAFGYRLRQFVPRSIDLRRVLAPIQRNELVRIQRDVNTGLGALLRDSTPRRRSGLMKPMEGRAAWRLPLADEYLVRWSPQNARPAVFRARWSSESEATMIVRGIADLIRLAGQNLRLCHYCKLPFVGHTKRQDYCSPACGQTERDQRKAEKRKRARRARATE